MCGRGILDQLSKEDARAAEAQSRLIAEGVAPEWADLVAHVGAEDAVMHGPRTRYNIAPTDWIPTLDLVAGEKILSDSRWGIHFPPRRASTFNARRESLQDPVWAPAYHENRVVHVLSGFYEWRGGESRDPVYVRLSNGHPMLMGAVSQDIGAHAESATVTQESPQWFADIHDRIPLILTPTQADGWLRSALSIDDVSFNFEAADFELRPVNTDVNHVTNDGPSLIQRRSTLF